MNQARKPEAGQALPLAAVAMLVIALLILLAVRLVYLFAADAFLQQTVDFAAAAAARPAGNALTAGQVAIDEARARASARAELVASLDQMQFVGATAQEMLAGTTIEFLTPAPGSCDSFPGDSACYLVPAVRVTATVPFDLFGFPVHLTRQGVATTAARPGEGEESPALAQPTPVAIPEEVFIPPTP